MKRTTPSLIHLCSIVTSDGKPGYAYLSIPLGNIEAFVSASENGQLNLEDFGQVLFVGEGETPPPEVKEMISEIYPSLGQELEVI